MKLIYNISEWVTGSGFSYDSEIGETSECTEEEFDNLSTEELFGWYFENMPEDEIVEYLNCEGHDYKLSAELYYDGEFFRIRSVWLSDLANLCLN